MGKPGHQTSKAEMKSTIDKHPDRSAIESGLARRVALRKLGKRFGVSIDALHRHKKKLLRDAPEMFLAVQARDWKVKPEELEALRLDPPILLWRKMGVNRRAQSDAAGLIARP